MSEQEYEVGEQLLLALHRTSHKYRNRVHTTSQGHHNRALEEEGMGAYWPFQHLSAAWLIILQSYHVKVRAFVPLSP